jgi:hypothetical protein
MKKIFVLIFCLVCASNIHAQTKKKKQKEASTKIVPLEDAIDVRLFDTVQALTPRIWYPGFYGFLSGGANFPIASTRQGYFSDALVGFQNNLLIYQLADLNFQFSENFGIGSVIRTFPVGNIEEKLKRDIEKEYPNYFTTVNDIRKGTLPNARQILLSYSIVKHWKNWFLMPSFQFGITTFKKFRTESVVKENGTQQLNVISLYPESTSFSNQNGGFTLGAGAKVAYYVGNKWGFFGETNFYSFNKRILYNYTNSDELAGTVVTQEIIYNSLITGITLNFGVFRRFVTW